MLSTSSVSTRDGVRALVTLLALAIVLVTMPGLRDAFSVGTVTIAIAGGIAVGVAAMAARVTRRDRLS